MQPLKEEVIEKKLVLLNDNGFSRSLCALLADYGMHAQIQECNQHGIKSYSSNNIYIYCPNYGLTAQSLPAPIERDRTEFLDAYRNLRAQHRDLILFHPCALYGVLSEHIQVAEKALLFGHQGSGNTITSRIVLALQGPHSPDSMKHLEALFTVLGQDYYALLMNAIHFDELDVAEFNMSGSRLGASVCSVRFNTGDQAVQIFDVPFSQPSFQPFSVFHHCPDKAAVQAYADMKYKLFFCARHPLDIIVSQMNFSESVFSNEFLGEYAKHMMLRFELWEEFLPLCKWVHYEALIKHPLKTIRDIADYMQCSITDEKAKEIWESLAFKQLEGAPAKHFGGGGSEKWRQHFTAENFDMFKTLGLDRLLEMLGYESGIAEIQAATADPSLLDDIPSREYQMLYTTTENSEYTDAWEYLAIPANDMDIECGIKVFCRDEERLNIVHQHLLKHDYYPLLCAAGNPLRNATLARIDAPSVPRRSLMNPLTWFAA